MLRAVLLALLFSGTISAQLPRGFYAWWSSPVVKDLNLSPDQQNKVREIVRDYRPHLGDIRTAVDAAEVDLEEQFSSEPVNVERVNKSIERLISARAELTRTLTQMSLRLRTVLTQAQWQELQQKRPGKAKENPPAQAQPSALTDRPFPRRRRVS